MDFLTLLILIMATWRLSSLLTDPNNEAGPFGLLTRFRDVARRITDAVECPWCMSIWIGLALTGLYWYLPDITFWLCLPFALSAGAIAWEKWNG